MLTGEELNYMARRAWLALKLAGQFPDVESGAEDAILKELWRMVEDRGYPVSEDDVLDAYTSGKEVWVTHIPPEKSRTETHSPSRK